MLSGLNELNKYSPINDIVNFLARKHLLSIKKADYKKTHNEACIELTDNSVQRLTHGVEHGVRASIIILILNELYAKHDAKGLPKIENLELLKMLQVAALLHDAGRESDVNSDTEESEGRSAKIVYDELVKLRFNTAEVKMLQLVVMHKDSIEGLVKSIEEEFAQHSELNKILKTAENCRTLLHDADCFEILRVNDAEFSHVHSDFYKFLEKQNSLLGKSSWKLSRQLKDLGDVLRAIKQMQVVMGDSPKDLSLEIKLPDQPNYVIKEEGNFSLLSKETYTNSHTPYDDIYEVFCNNEVCQKYLQNEFIAVPVFSMEEIAQQALNPEYKIESPKTNVSTYDIPLPTKNIRREKHLHTHLFFPTQDVIGHKELKLNPISYDVTTREIAVFKGNASDPATVMRIWVGFHPARVIRNKMLTHAKYNDDNIWKIRDWHAISTTKNIEVAKGYCSTELQQESENHQVGYVYLIVAPAGAIIESDDVSRGHDEVNIVDGVDQERIIAYRKHGKSFEGQIFVRQDAMRKYGATCVLQFIDRFLEKGEVGYFPYKDVNKNAKNKIDNLKKFFDQMVKLLKTQDGRKLNIDDLISQKRPCFKVFKELSRLDVTRCISYINNAELSKDNKDDLIKINMLLALKFSQHEYFLELAKVSEEKILQEHLPIFFKEQPRVGFRQLEMLMNKFQCDFSKDLQLLKFSKSCKKLQAMGLNLFQEGGVFGNAKHMSSLLQKFSDNERLAVLEDCVGNHSLDLSSLFNNTGDVLSFFNAFLEEETFHKAIKYLGTKDALANLQLANFRDDMCFFVAMASLFYFYGMSTTSLQQCQKVLPKEIQEAWIQSLKKSIQTIKQDGTADDDLSEIADLWVRAGISLETEDTISVFCESIGQVIASMEKVLPEKNAENVILKEESEVESDTTKSFSLR